MIDEWVDVIAEKSVLLVSSHHAENAFSSVTKQELTMTCIVA